MYACPTQILKLLHAPVLEEDLPSIAAISSFSSFKLRHSCSDLRSRRPGRVRHRAIHLQSLVEGGPCRTTEETSLLWQLTAFQDPDKEHHIATRSVESMTARPGLIIRSRATAYRSALHQRHDALTFLRISPAKTRSAARLRTCHTPGTFAGIEGEHALTETKTASRPVLRMRT
ncbi:hypothetical protein BV20DRAFT_971458 [Pilatotrama ljubarskyi]|nr:hypothetical protein BV20DRAFT_971458 [Pilatotrama ljubarskyi]